MAGLNRRQRQAVETIDGPLLVVAGPGTGKTQLLSARAANILAKTDAAPGNVLCLTFTDNAARNMRERLVDMIGRPAYHVAIHTFHSFGAEIISQYPDYFTSRQLLQQVDELGRYELLKEIFESLPHSDPLSAKAGDNFVFINDVLDVISWLKQNAVTPAQLKAFLKANRAAIDALAADLADAFFETPRPKFLLKYQKFLRKLRQVTSGKLILGFADFAALAAGELADAISQTGDAGRYAPRITAWRNRWCQKDETGATVFKDAGRNYRKMRALADIYEEFMASLAAQGLYDFDDMVMEAVGALENDPQLRSNLQERYLYVLVDEFQDTNKAQLRMLSALGDNPVFEGRPNLMAVGDDDQAIYAFQGAEASNMAAFAKLYSLEPVVLTENYRSDAAILETAEAVAGQISDRLDAVAPASGKHLSAAKSFPIKELDYLSFASELAQYDWIAAEIERLIKTGTPPEQIGVIAPRHRYLERLMPYLGDRKIPVVYERRENILEAPLIVQLTSMA
ncbi:MAG TPA: ATP-dependent helicase, partial [Chloroflexota bacterium]|nr:ATP-dependent helicase [Chloroflexota bacterium]